MMGLKNPKGFSFIEVTIAMTIAGFGLTMLFIVQGRLLQQGERTLDSWRAIVAIKNIFCDVAQKKIITEDLKLENSADGLLVSAIVKKINENSSLKKFKQVRLLEGEARWSTFGVEQRTLLMSAVVIPEKEKKPEPA